MASDDYPKDMSDPRWFDRDYKEATVKMPYRLEKAFGFTLFIGTPAVIGLVTFAIVAGGLVEKAGLFDFGLFR